MRFRKKEVNTYTRSTDRIIDMQIKSCSGNRVLGSDNPHKLPNYTNLSISGNVKMGNEFEDFMVNVAMNHDVLIGGQVFLFAGHLYDLNAEEIQAMKKFISERVEETPDDVTYISKRIDITPPTEDKRN